MSVSREQIERAIELAKQDNNQSAVDELTGMLGPADAPALTNGAPPVEGSALQPPPVDPKIEEDRVRARGLAQEQFDADQALLESGQAAPTPEQVNQFMGQRMGDTQWSDPSGRDLIVDPKTGETRWTAMSPDTLERVNERKAEIEARGSTSKAVVGALGYGGTRIVGGALEGAESRIEAGNNFQRFLLTGDKGLPKAEQERITNLAREKYGNDVDLGDIPASQVKEWIEQNEANALAFRNIAGDEWWEERKEFLSRGLAQLGSAWSYGKVMPGMGFGADDPEGDLTGPGSYEGIDYTGKRAPAYPGASAALRDWESDAKSEGEGIYEGLILPLTQQKTGKTPGQHATEFSEGFIDEYYSEEQLAEREMPIFSSGVEIKSIGDLFDSDLYTDPESKLMNPESLLLMFMENAPELGVSFAVTRGAGGMAARSTAKGAYGQTVTTMNKAREAAASRAGMLAGGATEGVLVATHLEQETRNILDTIPLETWTENSPQFNDMVEAGLAPEAAKQILTQEKASQAATAAAVITMVTGAPMNRFMGKSAAGQLVQKSPGARRTVGALGEPLTEGLQEVMEMMQTESAVQPIDPDNPIFADPNRYYEAFGGGALISTPFGVAGGFQPASPVGVKPEDVKAARATADFMEATNERFKYETKISDPEYIADSSPNQRLEDLNKLEQLQTAEAEAVLKAEPSMRAFLEEQGTQTAKTELKMLDRLVMRANAMKNDIAVASSKRTTAMQVWDAEREVMQDRADLQTKVNEQIIKLEDLQGLAGAIESVQNLESVTSDQEYELVREGYARRTKDGKLVITPKGRRATKELNRQARALKGKLDKGYTGKERRQTENLQKREMMDAMGPVEREAMLYEDNLTGAQNRRAFNERQENIDTKKGETKREVPGAQPAIAAVDVDSLAWVNDNMSHSAGDRLLQAVSDAIAKQEGVEVYRLGGDEFAVTGATEEAVESAMQAAAAELAETEIAADEDAVTPQITWGKGENYKEADAESLKMKQDRTKRGIVAPRKSQAATYKHRAQRSLFQKDEMPAVALPRHWGAISDMVERGDSVEVLTPDGAVQGVVTKITNKRGRPRMTVNIQGREFLFNPRSNHLIVSKFLDPADLAWITGDSEYAQPGRETFPQTLVDINIGHLGKDGQFYADLADDFEYEAPMPWWMDSQPQMGWHPTVPYMPVEKKANDAQINVALRIAKELSAGMANKPLIHIVRDLDSLRKQHPSVVQQIRDELGSDNFNGVRGYMDHINPENGIFIFPAHISASVGSSNFEQGIVETVWHEMVGHYGMRGTFGNEADLREEMHALVDAFPRLADFYSSTTGLDKNKPAEKQVLGEEMVAYIAGQHKAGLVKFTDKQKSAWQRFLNWIKSFMSRHKMDRYSPVKKIVTIHDSKELFWNDDRVQDLLSRSRDFLRHGNGMSWKPLEGSVTPMLRDRDIFQAGFVTAMNTATFKPSNREKGELAKQYGGKQNVPDEVPLFPNDATPNAWKQLIIKAQKEGHMSARELELSGLSENSDFYLFRDASYGTLERYMRQMSGNNMPTRWYQGIVPAHIAAELDGINDAMEKNYMAGPLQPTGQDGGYDGDTPVYDFPQRPAANETSAELMRARIAEIMSEKINPKKTRLTKELMMAHMLSENAYRIFVEKQGGHPRMSYSQAVSKLFGPMPDDEVQNLTDEQKELIKAERTKTRERGYDIGYDKDTDRWLDWAGHTTEYSEWSPQGSRYTDDFRVMLIKSEGNRGDMGYTGHYDSNIMHLRTGVASLLEWDGMPNLEFPNPAMQGKMLSLIELQSDWLQKLRKGFASADEKAEADRDFKEKRGLLNMVGDQLGRGISGDLWDAINSAIKPIVNLPDGTVDLPGGSMFPKMRERAVRQTGDVWEDLSADQKREVWKNHIIEEMDKVRDQFSDARDGVNEFIDEWQKKHEQLPGSMDARAFEFLDSLAAQKVAYAIRDELTRAIDTIQNTLRYTDSQTTFVQNMTDMQTNFGKILDRVASHSDYNEGLRLPMTEYLLKPMLEVVYGRSGAEKNRIAELMSGLKTRETATVRIPKVVLQDANTAMTTGYDPQALMAEIVSPSRVSRHSDIAPGALNLNAVVAGDDFIDVKVVGNKADVQKAKDLIPKLIETWIDNHGEEKRRIAQQQRVRPTATEATGDFDYDELESAYDLEEEDVNDDQTSKMSDYGVQSYYMFEENEEGEFHSEIIREAFDNMSETDWDELEEYNEGVSRQGQTYRDEVNIDEDGDVDNDDAERSLETAREEYRNDVMWDDEDYRMQASERTRELWDERGPTALIVGSLPTAWDADNEPTDYVEIMIKAEDPGDAYDIIIDGDEVNYDSDLDDAKRLLSDEIRDYYNNEDIVPPPGVPFGPTVTTATPEPDAQEQEDAFGPNWDMVKGNMMESLSMMSDVAQKMDKVYESYVVLQKKLGGGTYGPDSPVAKDEQWRPLALKFLISDAVRRGLGGVMWNNGMSSSTRGGMGSSGVTATTSITWSKETVGIRGEEQEVYVIRYPESSKPLVLSRSTMIPALGADVSRLIYMQETGKLPVPGAPDPDTDEMVGPENLRDNYIVASTNNETRAVYRRSNSEFMGFARDDAALETLMMEDIRHQRSRMRIREPGAAPPTGEPLGEVLSQGMIDQDLAGGLISVMAGDSVGGRYQDTFGRPRLAGARQSYEDITVRIWNKELKKYGVQISDTYVQAKNMQKAMTEEAQPTMKSPKRDEQIKEQHGRLHVTELTGGMHGWVVMSDKKGPVVNDVFTDKSYAQDRLDRFIEDNYGSDREGVKVMYFPINEKMREEFSGPVAPFHYDPKQDPDLESAADKIGYRKKPVSERFAEWKQGMGHEARQGMVDQFYGLKKALNDAGATDGAYISARLTTSLDSIMKGVLYYGHPVWKEGIVQSEGKGLLEIFQPILNDPDTWGLYMAGKRAKGLMLEAFTTVRDNPGKYKTPELVKYNGLDWNDVRKIQAAARHFPGKTENDKVMALLAWKGRQDKASGTVSRRDAIKMIASAGLNVKKGLTGGDAEAEKIYDIVTKGHKGMLRSRDPSKGAEWILKQVKKVTGMGDSDAAAAIQKAERIIRKAAQAETVRRVKSEAEKGMAWAKKMLGATGKNAKDAKGDINGLLGTGAIERVIQGGREHLFEAPEIEKMVDLGRKMPHFERVGKDYAAFNKKMLDFAEESGIIDKETRPMWENADYVPFYRVDDDRLAGSGMSPTAGIANQRSPIKRLKGGDQRVGDIMSNIMMNTTKLMDASIKNNAALESIDALKDSGIVSKKPLDYKPEIIPLAQLKKVLMDKGVIVPDDKPGIHLSDIPAEALTGIQKMFALKAPSGDGIISVMRNGKREYYYTDDMLLWRAMGSINKKQFGDWINYFRAPKRLLTTLITLDPAFMISNFIRDTGSAFVIGRDKGNLPVLSAMRGFAQALMEDETMRTLVSAGAAFENGYITGGDPRQTRKILEAAMKKRGFTNTVLDTPKKLIRAWLHLGSSIENSNRMAIYNAAIAAGKSKKRAAYEAKDLMDFSMGGDFPVIQFLIQTVPFMNARAQGIYRLGRGAVEHPVSFTMKGLMLSIAGLALYAAFKDDERYKELEAWDRHAYYHWWIGDAHYRLPKPFEVGAIFNTIPEMMFNYAYDKENDAGKTLLKEFAHMMGETFNMNPIPQTVRPLIESGANHNFFTDRPIVSYYESKRLPPDQYRYRTSPTMIELARKLPAGLDTATMGRARSPLHLQNMYLGYTGTIGRYVLQASDMAVQRMLDYPAPPSREVTDYPVLGRFVRGENPPRRTKYETEVYAMLDKITAIQGSLAFHEKQGNLERYMETHTEHEPYIRAAEPLEAIRENIQDINRAIMGIHMDTEMDPQLKQKEIDVLEETRNTMFKEGWKLRPGGEYNPPDEPVETTQAIDLIDNWGQDNSTAYMRRIQEDAPNTVELLEQISENMNMPQLASLAKFGEEANE